MTTQTMMPDTRLAEPRSPRTCDLRPTLFVKTDSPLFLGQQALNRASGKYSSHGLAPRAFCYRLPIQRSLPELVEEAAALYLGNPQVRVLAQGRGATGFTGCITYDYCQARACDAETELFISVFRRGRSVSVGICCYEDFRLAEGGLQEYQKLFLHALSQSANGDL